MYIERFVNSIFNSNAYILYTDIDDDVWIIDPGDAKPILEWIDNHHKYVKGILVTHAHFDHIYGINEILDIYGEAEVIASEEGITGLKSSSRNMSLYHDSPYEVYDHAIFKPLKDLEEMSLFNSVPLKAYWTPGHNSDCLSFWIGDNLFTGDSLIPNVKTFTKGRTGSKMEAEISIKFLISNFNKDTLLWPGHGCSCVLKDIDISKLI